MPQSLKLVTKEVFFLNSTWFNLWTCFK